MADKSAIEWTEATWQPITGCTIVSPGCTNCYAMRLAGTRLKHIPSRIGLTRDSKAGPVWTGEVRFNEQWLIQPLQWKRPRNIFVCAHGDLFHESVPDEWIDKVFAVMVLAPQHTFQVLTKRSKRMREYFTTEHRAKIVFAASERAYGRQWYDRDAAALMDDNWPLPNVWFGVSAERQQEADERIPHLLQTPAAVRWVSAEPLLGPIDLTRLDDGLKDGVRLKFDVLSGLAHDGYDTITGIFSQPDAKLDWVVVGGESGGGARPMHPGWARSLRDQCDAAGVPFFFKQWGEWHPHDRGMLYDGEQRGPFENRFLGAVEDDTSCLVFRTGKKVAGRLLDGVTHNDMPKIVTG